MVGPDSYGISRAPHYLGGILEPGLLRLRGFHPLRLDFPTRFGFLPGFLLHGRSAAFPGCSLYPVTTTPAGLAWSRFGLCPFRSPLLRVSLAISFPPDTEMFHFSGLPPSLKAHGLPREGCPIQRSAGHRMLAPRRGFSQLAASFFGIQRQGIPLVPFLP